MLNLLHIDIHNSSIGNEDVFLFPPPPSDKKETPSISYVYVFEALLVEYLARQIKALLVWECLQGSSEVEANHSDDLPVEENTCPITFETIKDPVLAADGYDGEKRVSFFFSFPRSLNSRAELNQSHTSVTTIAEIGITWPVL